ncbi:DUF7344 domain-containing protein [Halorussus sp. AFM4]|uniref:DUF7344 domain-containing protein n=1 Tax=Halorussus sp. AFM4 TaxID=3421651 RepID=UPI003EBCFD36
MGDCSAADDAVGTNDSEQVSELLDALASRQRRLALRCLRECETPMAVADLTDELVRRERGADPEDVPDARDRIYVQLYHNHLPKLVEVGAVVLDRRANLVELGPAAADLRPLLDAADEERGGSTRRERGEDGGSPAAGDGERRGVHGTNDEGRKESAVAHLHRALEATADDETDYHVRQALQLLRIGDG